MDKPFVVGLTGPTGAGKSTVAAAFASLGCDVIDCDRVAREITDTPACLSALQDAFGSDVASNGILNRPLLAERAFADAVSSQKLNDVTHPLIMEEVRRRIAASGRDIVVVDAALLFESGADALCHVTVAVVADPALRMQRIMRRDGISLEAAQLRLSAQKDDGFYTERADYVLVNDGTQEQLRQKAARVMARIRQEQEGTP